MFKMKPFLHRSTSPACSSTPCRLSGARTACWTCARPRACRRYACCTRTRTRLDAWRRANFYKFLVFSIFHSVGHCIACGHRAPHTVPALRGACCVWSRKGTQFVKTEMAWKICQQRNTFVKTEMAWPIKPMNADKTWTFVKYVIWLFLILKRMRTLQSKLFEDLQSHLAVFGFRLLQSNMRSFQSNLTTLKVFRI